MKKRFAVLLVFALIFSLLVACGGGKESSNSGEGGGTDTSSSSTGSGGSGTGTADSGSSGGDGGKTVELTYWDGTWAEEITPELVKEFEAQNPGIKIKVEYFPWDGMYDKFLVALRNDNGPDIINMAVDWTVPFAAMGKLQNITPFIEQYGVDMNDFYEGPLKTVTYNGQYYALPYRSEANALYYNKKIFADAGLDPEQPPATWDELIEFSKQIKEKTGIAGFGQSGSEFGNFTAQLYYLIYSNGGSVLNEDYTKSALTSPEAVEAAQIFVDMYRKHKISPDSTMENNNTVNRNLFASEKVAMFISGNYDVAAVREANPDLDFGTALQPALAERKPILGGWNAGVTNTAKDAEAAFKFVNFLASPEISPRYSLTFSSRKSAAGHEKYKAPEFQPFLESLNYAQAMPPIPQWTQIKQIVYNHMQSAMIGDRTVEQALQDASKEIDALLAGN